MGIFFEKNNLGNKDKEMKFFPQTRRKNHGKKGCVEMR